jgi:hypothetical protein
MDGDEPNGLVYATGEDFCGTAAVGGANFGGTVFNFPRVAFR